MQLKKRIKKLNQAGILHQVIPIMAFLVLFGAIGAYFYATSGHAATNWTGTLQLGLDRSLCMTNQDDSNTPNTSVTLTDCATVGGSNADSQTFSKVYLSGSSTEFQLKAQTSNACVDDTGDAVGTSGNRVYVQTWPCSTTDPAQIWTWTGSTNHELKVSNKDGCINDPGSATNVNSGTVRLVVYSCDGNPTNAQWLEASTPAGSGSSGGGTATGPTGVKWINALSVGPQNSGYCMDAPKVASGDTVVLNKCATVANQKWILIHAGTVNTSGGVEDLYEIQNDVASTSQCLDDWGQSTQTGKSNYLKLDTCNAADADPAQLWGWEYDGHQLENFAAYEKGSALCIDNLNSGTGANNPIDLSGCNASSGSATNQDWYEAANSASSTTTESSSTPPVTSPVTGQQQPQTPTTLSQTQVNQENKDLQLIIQSLNSSEKGAISCSQLQSAQARAWFDCPQTTTTD